MSITLNKLINEELSKLSEKERKLLKDKAKKQESKKYTKESLSQMIGEEFDKLTEGRMKRVTKSMWKKMKENDRVNALLSAFKDPDDAEEHVNTDWEDLPSQASHMYLYEGKVNEAKEYKAGDTVKLKTGETVKINQVVQGPQPKNNTYRAKVKGKQVDFGLNDISEGKLSEDVSGHNLDIEQIDEIVCSVFKGLYYEKEETKQ